MARIEEPTKEQEKLWNKWVLSRPAKVRKVAKRFDPWSLYKMKDSNTRCTLHSFEENKDGTVTLKVRITGEYNLTMFDRMVFGVKPDDLEPCDLPSKEEPLAIDGTTLENALTSNLSSV